MVSELSASGPCSSHSMCVHVYMLIHVLNHLVCSASPQQCASMEYKLKAVSVLMNIMVTSSHSQAAVNKKTIHCRDVGPMAMGHECNSDSSSNNAASWR
jgi:hypothetical protein